MPNASSEATVPFHLPWLTGREAAYVAQVVGTGRIASDGPFTRRCAELLERAFGIRRVLMTPSCTAALELAASLCDVGPGDEVILPSYTFVSTASAFARLGARPVFVEIRSDTLNLDERCVEAAITPRTRAIVPVHYAGVACGMDPLMELARRHRLMVVEDAAQAVNARYRDRHLGSIGHLGAFSFHETKTLACGEGGALCINDPLLAERAEILRDKGTNRAQFFRGEVEKYTWVDVGSSWLPSELSCAFLAAQLEERDQIASRRQAVFQRYVDGLAPLVDAGLVRVPVIPADCHVESPTFFLLLNEVADREPLLDHLREQGVSASFHYVPLHLSPVGRRYGYQAGDLPVTEDLARRIVRLPSFTGITPMQQRRVIDAVLGFYGRGTTCPASIEVIPSAAEVAFEGVLG